jgi:PAS domain S-box-containing protein
MVPGDVDVAARGAEETGGQGDVIALLADFDRRISALSFKDVTHGALAFMDERLGTARASVALLCEDGKSFRMFDATMDVRSVESGKLIPFSSASLGATVERQSPIYRADIRAWPVDNAVDTALLAAGLRCTFSVPLLCGGRCLGTLNSASKEVDGLPPTKRQVIELLAPRLAFAIHAGIAYDQLTESQSRLRDVFATVGDGIVVADTTNRKIEMVNATICTMLGRSEEELLRLTIDDLHPASLMEEIIAKFVAMVEGHLDHALDIPVIRADGTEILADISARRTTLSGKRCVVGVFRDSAVRRQRENEQVQVQKLESIRTLAAGIAHDFNNLLTGLIGNMSLAQTYLSEGSEPWELLGEARKAAMRSTALTRQLLTFAKGGTPVRKHADIVQVVRDAANMVVGGTKVQCQLSLPDHPLWVMGDEGQLAQVVHNVVRNAVDAMPAGGTVQVKISTSHSPHLDKEREICIEIGDHGAGIPPELLDKVFLPFFTTKPDGNGLGLAVVYSIVQAHEGRITVASQRGAGTTFNVFLPLAEEQEIIPSPSPECSVSGRVLVMDDQDVVRRFADRALRLAGYDVATVENGAEAVAAYRAAKDGGARFDVVILDLTVPGGMGGREAAAGILGLDPDARLIVSSGYSEDAVMSDHTKYGFRSVLPKPYGVKQLTNAVAQLLQATGSM